MNDDQHSLKVKRHDLETTKERGLKETKLITHHHHRSFSRHGTHKALWLTVLVDTTSRDFELMFY